MSAHSLTRPPVLTDVRFTQSSDEIGAANSTSLLLPDSPYRNAGKDELKPQVVFPPPLIPSVLTRLG